MWFSNIQAIYFILVECHSLSFSGVILFLLSHQEFMNVKLFIKSHVSRQLQDLQYFIPHPHLRQLWFCWDWASFCSLCYLEFMIHLSQDPHILRTVSMWHYVSSHCVSTPVGFAKHGFISQNKLSAPVISLTFSSFTDLCSLCSSV